MVLLYAIAGVSALCISLAATRTPRPLRAAGASAVCGFCALGLVNVLSFYTGVALALNFTTAFVTAVLGVPGVILMLLLMPLL